MTDKKQRKPKTKPALRRIEGWEAKLRECLETAREAVLSYGTFDCCMHADTCVEAMTGESLMGELCGTYDSEKSAALAIEDFGGGDLKAAAIKLFEARGCAQVDSGFARRGDVALVVIGGRQSMGVVDLSGRDVSVPNIAGGLARVPLSSALVAFKIG